MQTILDSKKVDKAVQKLADRIAAQVRDDVELVLIGIRSRGEILAKRLCEILSDRFAREVPLGVLDITLYRDDLNDPKGKGQPTVRTTEIPFDVNEKLVVLVDDVLYTGRSVRAALDALIDLGRPSAIRLAVLVERGGREYPIQADYIAHKVDIEDEESVEVNFVETDGKDEVVVAS